MSSIPTRTTWFSSKSPSEDYKSKLNEFGQSIEYNQIFNFQTLAAFALGSVTSIGVAAVYTRYFKRIPNADHVPAKMVTKRKWIKGVVTSVGDGDGFRLYHTPGPFWRWPLKFRKVPITTKDLKDETISIRIAGVDAPEAAHFGKTAQPFSSEALRWLKNEIEGKRVWVQFIRRDQYNRIVSIPVYPPRLPFFRTHPSRCVSIQMLSAGLATTYEQSGAEYGPWGKDVFIKYEEAARAAKKGMWGSKELIETPAEYKKRYREGTSTGVEATASGTVVKDTRAAAPQGKNSTQNQSAGWTRFLPFFSSR